jgi:hypothetical protein
MNNNPKILATASPEIVSPISIGLTISGAPRLKFLNSLFKSYLNLV